MKPDETVHRHSVVCRNAEILGTGVGIDLVMMDVEKGYYYGLDGIGRRIWEAMAEPIQVDTLCRSLADHYDVDVEVCLRDVLSFLEQLRERGLVGVQQAAS